MVRHAELIGDEDQAFLSNGICNGFKLAPVDCNFVPVQQGNYRSATCAEQKLALEETILGEIAEGNYIITDVKPTIVSALGAIPKLESSEGRLIHNCSHPVGRALNNCITVRFKRYFYTFVISFIYSMLMFSFLI